MKLLLAAVNAKYIHSNPAVYSLRAYAQARTCRGNGHGQQSAAGGRTCRLEIGIAEYTINQTADEILADLFERAPRVLAFSCYIWNLEMIEKLLADLPKILPDTDVWVGGPEVSYDAPDFLRRHPQVRGVLTGEGEEPFAQLAGWYETHGGFTDTADHVADPAECTADHAADPAECTADHAADPAECTADYAADLAECTADHVADPAECTADHAARAAECGHLASIRGLVWRRPTGEICQNPPQERISMDDLPFLYQELSDFENRIIYYESSRGCPFSCSYCLSSIDKSVRFRKADRVKEELQFFLDRKVPQVKFVDRTFNCRHDHAMEIWTYIRNHDNGVTNFHFEIAAELLNDEEIALLQTMRPGLVQLEIGVQSTNPETLRAIDRVSDFAKLSEIVRRLQKERNMHLHLDLIAGLPFEDYESFVRSFNDVYRLRPQQLQLGFLKILKGSKMQKNAAGYGLSFHAQPPYEVLATRWISYGELLRLKAVEEMLEIYCNSNQFTHTVRRLESAFAHPFVMLAALADYTAAHVSRGAKISRSERFRLLRGFIKSRTDDPVFDELLLLDVYLRENSKSRPEWARDLQPYRERILDFYRREEEARVLLPDYEGRSARQLMHMTHLEHFTCDILGDLQAGEHWVLFDYGRRDPLTGDARTVDVTEQCG